MGEKQFDRHGTSEIVFPLMVKFLGRHSFPVSIIYKSKAGRYRPVRVADGPITARSRFIKNASWVAAIDVIILVRQARYHSHCTTLALYGSILKDTIFIVSICSRAPYLSMNKPYL